MFPQRVTPERSWTVTIFFPGNAGLFGWLFINYITSTFHGESEPFDMKTWNHIWQGRKNCPRKKLAVYRTVLKSRFTDSKLRETISTRNKKKEFRFAAYRCVCKLLARPSSIGLSTWIRNTRSSSKIIDCRKSRSKSFEKITVFLRNLFGLLESKALPRLYPVPSKPKWFLRSAIFVFIFFVSELKIGRFCSRFDSVHQKTGRLGYCHNWKKNFKRSIRAIFSTKRTSRL